MSKKKSINLLFSTDEKKLLKSKKIRLADIHNYSADEISVFVNASEKRQKEIRALIEFQNIPSLGINFATDLINQGYFSLVEFQNADPVKLYDQYEHYIGMSVDPSVEDSYRLLVHFANNHDYSKRWWHFTLERKNYRKAFGYLTTRPRKPRYNSGHKKKTNTSALGTYSDDQSIFNSSFQNTITGLQRQTNASSGILNMVKAVNHLQFTSPIVDALNKSSAMRNIFIKNPILDAASRINEIANNSNSIMNLIGSSSSMGLAETSAIKGLGAAIMQNSILKVPKYEHLGISSIAQQLSANLQLGPLGVTKTLSEALRISRLAENNLASFAWASLGSKINAAPSHVDVAQKAFLSFSSQYSGFLKSIQAKPDWIYDAPKTSKLPSLEFYSHSRFLEVISANDIATVEVQETDREIDKENTDTIQSLLPKLNADMVKMWSGALQALNSNNPDRVRHFITSVRELYTHILHLLAPDDKFVAWDIERKHFANGKPTRRGRLNYICRNLQGGNDGFSKFLSKDMDTTIALIELLQGGTHAINPSYNETQLSIIKTKAETTLRFLLNVEFEINRL